MRSYQIKRKNNIIIGVLCAVVLLMVVGYAAFSSILNIKGTSGISSNWDIEITNIRGANPWGGDAYDISEPTYTKDTATFNTGLKTPGDSDRVYEVEITNKGTLDGVVIIANLSCGNNDAIDCSVYESDMQELDSNGEFSGERGNFIDFGNGQQDYSGIAFTLGSGEKHYIYVDVWYDWDVESQPENLNANINLELTYEQAVTDNSGSVLPSSAVTVYRFTTDKLNIGDSIEGIETTTDYTTLNTDFFLKHMVKNNNIMATELCFIKDGNIHCLKPNNYDASRDKIRSIFGSTVCTNRSDGETCQYNSLQVYACSTSGLELVSTGVENSEGRVDCVVKADRSSECTVTNY